MHDVFNKLTPCSFSSLFNCSNKIHNYNTILSSAGNYHIKHTRCNKKYKSPSRHGAKIWNSIPQELRKLSRYAFKKNIQNQLLQVLKEEDNYVGIPTLINKFQNVCPK